MSVAMDSHPGKTFPKPISPKFGPAIPEVKCVNLALQGGSAHGAFTWGVLDRLMEEPRIEVEGVSATSAGAMNAAVMAHGLTTGGRKGAREALEEFWHGVARISAPFGALQVFEALSRFLSPYQLNPFNYNPLRQHIRFIDFERLRQGSAVKLFLSATNVRTGKIKVFTDQEITADCVLASACLPFLYQAVEIDGEHYWDGGYMGKPSIVPADLLVPVARHSHCARQSDRATGQADERPRNYESCERDQLQFLAYARDASRRFRDKTDRRRETEPGRCKAHAHPFCLRRRRNAWAWCREQTQR